MLNTLQKPPEKGSLQESTLILLLMRQETIEHAKFRALSQIIIDQDKGPEAFEEYMTLAFPYLEATKRREKDDFIQRLNEEAARGPMRINPMPMPQFKSKLKAAHASGSAKARKSADALYSKLESKDSNL